jgi:hypothetical protein
MAGHFHQSERKRGRHDSRQSCDDRRYRAGIPGSGKPVPDGAKMAKIHWTAKQNEFFPEATVPGTLLNVD